MKCETINVLAATTATVLFCATTVIADTLLVPSEFATIQAAIDAAVDGDEVVVADGVYANDSDTTLNFLGKAITVRSENGPDTCMLDPEGDGIGCCGIVRFESAEGPESVFQGFSLHNMTIRCTGASPMVRNCWTDSAIELQDSSARVIETQLEHDGGFDRGVTATGSGSPVFINCRISDFSVLGSSSDSPTGAVGGGVYASCDSITMINCAITNNNVEGSHGGGFSPPGRGGGVRIVGGTTGLLINCVIADNTALSGGEYAGTGAPGRGGGVCASSSTTMINCTLAGNKAGAGESWFGGYGAPGRGSAVFGSPIMINCIVWDNFVGVEEGKGSPTASVIEGSPDITYSIVQGGWAGTGNIDVDPLFVASEAGDYRLLAGSPAIDAGANSPLACVLTGDLGDNERFFDDRDTPDTGVGNGPIVDFGPYEFESIPANDPDGTDCDLDAQDDACMIAAGQVSDCNGNGVPDLCDLASGLSDDCNGNGILDSCDIDAGLLTDCDADGIADECEIKSTGDFSISSEVLTLVGSVGPLEVTFERVPPAVSDVIFEFEAFGAFDDSAAVMYVALNGESIGHVFVDGADCAVFSDQLSISAVMYTVLTQGTAHIDLTFAPGIPSSCGTTNIQVFVQYEEGVFLADCLPADLNGDGGVGPADLAQLLGAWGPCSDPRNCPEDLNGDGSVGPADLALLLGSWG